MELLLSISPFKGFGHCGIEIRYKSQHASLQILHRGETGTPQELPVGHTNFGTWGLANSIPTFFDCPYKRLSTKEIQPGVINFSDS